MNPRQMVAETLRNGRRYARSYKDFRKVLAAMQRDGEIYQVAPEPGLPRNMVELTGRGWRIYFGEDLVVGRLDRFAELLSQGFEPRIVGEELGLTKGQVAAALRDIRAHLGAQAA